MTPHDVVAIIPAAGRSRRMGHDKQLIDIAGKPMLRHVVDTLLAADVAQVVVVTRRAISDQLGLHTVPHVLVAFNEDASTEMIDSVRIGLNAIENAPAGILVCPGDLPRLTIDDAKSCIDAFGKRPDRIIIATRHGRRGHPLIIPFSLSPFIHSVDCDDGLHRLRLVHADLVQPVECMSDGVLHDADTPDDLPPKTR